MDYSFTVKLPDFCFPKILIKECKVDIKIPLPSYETADDYARKMCATPGGTFLCYEDVKKQIQEFIRKKTEEFEDEIGDTAIAKKAENNFEEVFSVQKSLKNEVNVQSFPNKFTYVVSNCSSQSLITLMQMEILMKKEMTEIIRARNWEIDQISKKCERVLHESHENDMHPHKISMLNEKLRQIYTTYSHQVAQLSENQKNKYRKAVDSLFSHGSIPADLLENVNLDDDLEIVPQIQEIQKTEGVNESFTIYIGAQLKSMHNACLVTVYSLTDLCQTFKGDWTISNRLEMATKLYGRSLAAVTLLVPRDPMHHINSSTQFSKICEQSTELHFEPLVEQLKQLEIETRRGNIWRSDVMEKSNKSNNDEINMKSSNVSLRNDSTLAVGDVYCTKHSNLHKMQVVFHLVVDEQLQSVDISSRHACLNGIRNIIRMTSSFGITSIHLPLLLIDRPDESTTISWCVKRAEMVYKCVKGYLMEVCGGTNIDFLPHYNIHFVLPSGLAPTIYSTISNMFPTIFHLVPSVTITM